MNRTPIKRKAKRHQKAIHVHTSPENFKDGKLIYKTEEWEVRIMAIAEGYAMVRRLGCMPYICNIKELKFLDKA